MPVKQPLHCPQNESIVDAGVADIVVHEGMVAVIVEKGGQIEQVRDTERAIL